MRNNHSTLQPKITLCPPKAFTLAEVLITLVIIGVVAAITVPSVIQNTQKAEIVSKLKKTFSTLSQATDQIIMEEGPVKYWATTIDGVYELYKKHLILVKDCGSASGCIPQGAYKRLNSGYATNWDTRNGFRKFILSDGTQVSFTSDVFSKNCNLNNSIENGSNDVCASMHIDINGEKAPNTIGRDVFSFVLKENGLYPAGCDVDDLCNKDHAGYACACKVIYEGKIDY